MTDTPATVTLYGIRNCDTCRRAWKWLEEQGIDYRFHDLRRDGIDAGRIETWCDHLDTDTLINRRGQTWRRLSPEDRERDETGLRALLGDEPTLIKRPVIETPDGGVYVGWNETVQRVLSQWYG